MARDGAHFLLRYDLVDDHNERRAEFRDAHLALATEASQRGQIVLGGALADRPDRALLAWRVGDRTVIDDLVRADPFVINGLVRSWSVRPLECVGTAS